MALAKRELLSISLNATQTEPFILNMTDKELSAPMFCLLPRGGSPRGHFTSSRRDLRLTYLTLRDQGASALDYTPLYQGPDGHWYTCQQQLV